MDLKLEFLSGLTGGLLPFKLTISAFSDFCSSISVSTTLLETTDSEGFEAVDQVGVIMVVDDAEVVIAGLISIDGGRLELEAEDETPGWWMIGGVFGFVGEGRVIGSQKTTPFEPRFSFFSAFDKMELWEIPVEGAREMRDCAEGVAV